MRAFATVATCLLSPLNAMAMPDASTMKRLETVAYYLGAADHCDIKIETPRLRGYFERYEALDPVTFGAIDRFVARGAMFRHQPGSSHCVLTERIMRDEGIID